MPRRALACALVLAAVAAAPGAYADVRNGTGGPDRITGTNVRDLLFGGHGSEIDCGDGNDVVYVAYLTLGRLERGSSDVVQDPLVREPWSFPNCETLIAATVRDLGLSPERPNPRYIDAKGEEGIDSNAGLQGAGPPGAGAVALVNNLNADQPAPKFGQATQGNDSLSVRGGKALANDGGLYGLSGNDRLEGASSDDALYGGSGNDGLFGRGGSDILVGGPDNDTLEGGRGEDLLDGGPGGDRLNGGFGDDVLSGGSGDDVLTSLSGGRDMVNCGPGNDRVIADRSDTVVNCERRG